MQIRNIMKLKKKKKKKKKEKKKKKKKNKKNEAGKDITTEIWDSFRDLELDRQKVWRKFSPEIELFGSLNKWIHFLCNVDYGKSSFSDAVLQSVGLEPLVWGVGNWGVAPFGDNLLLINPTFWFVAKGNRTSFRIKTALRIRFLGYQTKFREVSY